MTAKINFSKIQKCDQVWDDMPVCASGRLCQQCDKVIHDFRGMSDWDIAVKHAHSSSKVCGIYDQQTLDGRTSKQIAPLKKVSKAIWTATMAGLTSITSVNAQIQTDEPVHQFQEDLTIKDSIAEQNSKSYQDTIPVIDQRIIKGKISDADNREGIVAATIIIAGTEIGTVSDYNGFFSLDLSESLSERDSVKLLITYIGYARSELVIHVDRFEGQRTVVLKEELMMTEDVTITSFGVERPPWYKRFWNKITKVFR